MVHKADFTNPKLRVGILINPIAGVGGSVALKGSDNVVELALSLGAIPKAFIKMQQALESIAGLIEKLEIYTPTKDMGGDLIEKLAKSYKFKYHYIYDTPTKTSSKDTIECAKRFLDANLDLILFAGGDGTARDLCAQIGDKIPVLGIPAGVKIHSGVYAISPYVAGIALKQLIEYELPAIFMGDVLDIDEEKFRQGTVQTKYFGQMQVLAEAHYIQAVKIGGVESEELVLLDIADYIIENMEDDVIYVMGSGSTVAFIMDKLNLDNTLLGVDLILNKKLLKQDITQRELIDAIKDKPFKLIVTIIGGQGHIFGRGNQQLGPEFIKKLKKDDLIIVASKTKLKNLNHRPIVVDTGDFSLDKQLVGFYKITTGYKDFIMYPVDLFLKTT